MGQSLSVALKSLRMELKRLQRRRSAEVRQEEHQNILVASGSTSCAVAFEEDRPLVDPPFL